MMSTLTCVPKEDGENKHVPAHRLTSRGLVVVIGQSPDTTDVASLSLFCKTKEVKVLK